MLEATDRTDCAFDGVRLRGGGNCGVCSWAKETGCIAVVVDIVDCEEVGRVGEGDRSETAFRLDELRTPAGRLTMGRGSCCRTNDPAVLGLPFKSRDGRGPYLTFGR